MTMKSSAKPARLSLLESLVNWSIAGWVWLYSFYCLYSELSRREKVLYRHSRPIPWSVTLDSVEFDVEIDVVVLHRLLQCLGLMVLQLVATELLRRTTSRSQQLQLLPTLHFFMGSLLMLLLLGWKLYVVVVSVSLFGYIMSEVFHSLLIAYLLPTAAFFGQGPLMEVAKQGRDLEYEQMVLFYVISSWLLSRMLMYIVDCVKNEYIREHGSFAVYLGYVFYGPVLKGPLIQPQDYLTSLSPQNVPSVPLRKRLLRLFSSLIRLLFVLVVLIASRYFVPLSSLSAEPSLGVTSLGRWEVLGAKVFTAVYFCMKYVFIYGLGCELATFEGVGVPLEPRCPLLVLNLSELWKYFDNGMYLFMRDYLYRPLSGGKNGSWLRNVLSSMVIFAYVYFWHGRSQLIFHWAVINFVLVTVEETGGRLLRSDRLSDWKQALGPAGCRRCEALVNSAPFFTSQITQLGFISGSWRLHQHTVALIMESSFVDWIVIVFFYYCIYNTVIDIKHWWKRDCVAVDAVPSNGIERF